MQTEDDVKKLIQRKFEIQLVLEIHGFQRQMAFMTRKEGKLVMYWWGKPFSIYVVITN